MAISKPALSSGILLLSSVGRDIDNFNRESILELEGADDCVVEFCVVEFCVVEFCVVEACVVEFCVIEACVVIITLI